MKIKLALVAALSLGLAGAAAAQTAPAGGPTAKGNAPLKHAHTVNDGAAKPAHNSFTEGQARQHILNSGYGAVTGLTMGSDGVWRGRASKGGSGPVDVAMDFKGNVTQGHAGMGGAVHNGGAAMHRTPMHSAGMRTGSAMASGAGAMHADGGAVHHTSVAHYGAGGHHMRHTRKWRRHHHHAKHHMAHGRTGLGMSGVDRNDNGISDKEDRRQQH